MDGLAGCALSFCSLFIEERVTFRPQLFGDNGFHLVEHPFTLRLELPCLLAIGRLGIVRAADTLGEGVTQETVYCGIGKERAVTGSVASIIQHPRYGLLAAVFLEELVHELADGGFCFVRKQLALLPLVAERGLAPQRLPHLGADRDGSGNARCDLFSLPLGHSCDHGVEKAACGCGSVDGFCKRDEVSIVLTEEVGEFEEFLGIPGEAGEFGENEAGDVATLDVSEHPLGFGGFLYCFARYCIKTIDLDDVPAFCFSIEARTAFVVFRTLPFYLVFGGNPNPDTNALGICLRLHIPSSASCN